MNKEYYEEEIENLNNKIEVIKECYREIIKMKDEEILKLHEEIAELSCRN